MRFIVTVAIVVYTGVVPAVYRMLTGLRNGLGGNKLFPVKVKGKSVLH